jgi:hypothetical protein
MKTLLYRSIAPLLLLVLVFATSVDAGGPTLAKDIDISGANSKISSGAFAVKTGVTVTFESGSTLNVSAATVTFADGQIPWAKVLKTAPDLAFATTAISASALDWATSQSFSKTLAANSTFTFANTKDGQTIVVALTNTASNYTVTWPTVSWSGGSAPVQTIGVHTDVYTFVKIGSIVYGSVVQNF